MLNFVRKHVRWAGIVVQLVGIAVSNMQLFWLGTFIFGISYMWSVAIMEEMWSKIEEASEKKEDTDDREAE